jgi:hypothetical protein
MSRLGCFVPPYSSTNCDDSYTVKIENGTTDSWNVPFFNIFNSNEKTNDEFRKFKKHGHTYYAIPHNTTYAVRMTNNTDSRANATLKIDGEEMGVWRIESYSDIVVERPTHNNRKFTFVREASWQASMGGMKKGDSNNGLVEVTFVPEYKPFKSVMYDRETDGYLQFANKSNYDECDYSLKGNSSNALFAQNQSLSSSARFSAEPQHNFKASNANYNYSVGGTVLGDDSSQRFSTASHMTEDYSKRVIKRIRLVVAEDYRKPYVSIRTPGRAYENDFVQEDPVPPQIGRHRRGYGREYDEEYSYTGMNKNRYPSTDYQY